MSKIIDFAKQNGYETAKYIGKWRDYDVYEPIFNSDEISFTGVPLVVLVRGEEMRMSTVEEAYRRIDEAD